MQSTKSQTSEVQEIEQSPAADSSTLVGDSEPGVAAGLEHHEGMYSYLPEVDQSVAGTHGRQWNRHDEAKAMSTPAYNSEIPGSQPVITEEKIVQDPQQPQAKSGRRYLGLTRKWAIILITAILLIMVGVIVGVVVYTRHKSSTATKTNTSAPVTSGTTGMAKVDCPGVDGTRIDTPSTWTIANTSQTTTFYGHTSFQIHCSKNWPVGSDAANGNGTVHNYDGIWGNLLAYTLEECLQYCADYNNQSAVVDISSSGSNCVGVTYIANLTDAIPRLGNGNCFLKDRVGNWSSAKSWTAGATLLDRSV